MAPLRRRIQKFQENPASIRYATMAIIMATVVIVVLGAVLVWLFDRKGYPTFGEAIWFTLQTVTTVGYGDVTPDNTLGRAVASVVMVTGIGLITVVTAAITSAFVQAARVKFNRGQQVDNTDAFARIEASLETISARLERLESTLADSPATPTRTAEAADDDDDE